jgi:uncharacterized membrane protein
LASKHDCNASPSIYIFMFFIDLIPLFLSWRVDQDETKRVMLAEIVVEFILCSRMKSSVAAPPQGIVYPLPPTLILMLDSADINQQSWCVTRCFQFSFAQV